MPAPRERHQRERHFRRRRRDLLEDLGLALLLTVLLITLTAGLGVLALLEIPAAGLLIGSLLAERRLAGRGVRRSARRPHRRG